MTVSDGVNPSPKEGVVGAGSAPSKSATVTILVRYLLNCQSVVCYALHSFSFTASFIQSHPHRLFGIEIAYRASPTGHRQL